MKTNYCEMWKDYEVTDCESVREFINRYYRSERIDGHIPVVNPREHLISSYQSHVKEVGCTWISKFDSVTGEVVAYIPGKRGLK